MPSFSGGADSFLFDAPLFLPFLHCINLFAVCEGVGGEVHVPQNTIWRSEDNLQESVPSIHHGSPVDQAPGASVLRCLAVTLAL